MSSPIRPIARRATGRQGRPRMAGLCHGTADCRSATNGSDGSTSARRGPIDGGPLRQFNVGPGSAKTFSHPSAMLGCPLSRRHETADAFATPRSVARLPKKHKIQLAGRDLATDASIPNRTIASDDCISRREVTHSTRIETGRQEHLPRSENNPDNINSKASLLPRL
jgi:hypothetical protein